MTIGGGRVDQRRGGVMGGWAATACWLPSVRSKSGKRQSDTHLDVVWAELLVRNGRRYEILSLDRESSYRYSPMQPRLHVQTNATFAQPCVLLPMHSYVRGVVP